MDREQYRQRINLAEEAVSDIKDQYLKRIAFKAIITQLLSGGTVSPTDTDGKHKKTSVKVRAKGKKVASEIKKSDISLSVENLNDLKAFFEDSAPKGEEKVVFTLARFLVEKKERAEFNEADIFSVYSNLIPLKPSIQPPILNLEKIKRSLRWLSSPSRKKLWLESAGEGLFRISAQGQMYMLYGEKES
jgi:hypothetical protein